MVTHDRPLTFAFLTLAGPALLLGCSTPSPAMRMQEGTIWHDNASACEAPEADQCVVLACDGEGGICGVFACEDVELEAVGQAHLAPGVELVRGSAFRPPIRGPGPRRSLRHTGVRETARPLRTFHFEYRSGYLPAFPRFDGKVIKHHLFPQTQEFREWFRRAGIDIHQYTLLIPEHVHRRIHSGDGRGGPWNAAWREFRNANPNPPKPELLLRHALELALRFKLAGPMVPYNQPVMPVGPQLYAN